MNFIIVPEILVCRSFLIIVCMLIVSKTICLGVVVILLLNVMKVLRVGGYALLDRPCMVFQIIYVLCL